MILYLKQNVNKHTFTYTQVRARAKTEKRNLWWAVTVERSHELPGGGLRKSLHFPVSIPARGMGEKKIGMKKKATPKDRESQRCSGPGSGDGKNTTQKACRRRWQNLRTDWQGAVRKRSRGWCPGSASETISKRREQNRLGESWFGFGNTELDL